MRYLAAAACLLCLPAAPGAAETSPSTHEAGQPTQIKPKLVCRPLPARTGSHRPQGRVCKTAEEWRARDRDVYMQAPMEDQTRVEPAGPKI